MSAVVCIVGSVLVGAWAHAPRVVRPVVAPDDAWVLLGRSLRFRRGGQAWARDRLVGRVAVGALVGLFVHPAFAVVVAFAVYAHDVGSRRRAAARRAAAVERELPEVIDLLSVALGGGGSVHAAVRTVSSRPIGVVSARFAAAMAEVEAGDRLAEVLGRAAADLGPAVRPLVRTLAGAEHYGTSIEATLERLAHEARVQRRRQAEIRARRVPVRLLGPLVLGVLPAFVLLTVVPTVARTLEGLSVGSPTP